MKQFLFLIAFICIPLNKLSRFFVKIKIKILVFVVVDLFDYLHSFITHLNNNKIE